MQKHKFYFAVFIIVAVQVTGFVFVLNRLPESTANNDDKVLAGILLELEQLKKQQANKIRTSNGIEINVSQEDIERAISNAVYDALADQQLVAQSSASNGYQQLQEEPVLSVEQEQARIISEQEANTVMDGAINSGRWTTHDTDALMPHLDNLSQAQRNALIERFTAALGENSIQLEGPPPPL